MGSPLGLLMANVIMTELERVVVKGFSISQVLHLVYGLYANFNEITQCSHCFTST